MNIGDIKFRYYDSEVDAFVYSDQQIPHKRNPAKQLVLFFDEVTKFGRGEIEVQQYTGCEDRDGNPIYEGDIVKTIEGNEDFSDREFNVVFEESMFMIDQEYIEISHVSRFSRVIGNIHKGYFDENDELIC